MKIFRSSLLLTLLLVTIACSEETQVSNVADTPVKTRAKNEVLIDEEAQQFGIVHNMYMDYAVELSNHLYETEYAGIQNDQEFIKIAIQDCNDIIAEYVDITQTNLPNILLTYGGPSVLNVSEMDTPKIDHTYVKDNSRTRFEQDLDELKMACVIGEEEYSILKKLVDAYYGNYSDEKMVEIINDCIVEYNEASSRYATRAISSDLAIVTPVISIAAASMDWWMADESEPYIVDDLHTVIAADLAGALFNALVEGVEHYIENGEINDYGKIGREALYGAAGFSLGALIPGIPKTRFPWKKFF